MALFRNLCVNQRDFLCGVHQYASAQSLDFLDLTETGNPPRRGGTESPQGTKKLGTRPGGVGLSPRRGRRKLLIYKLETVTSVHPEFPDGNWLARSDNISLKFMYI